MAASRPLERFTFLRYGFDVSGCEDGIEAGRVPFTELTWDREFIRAYAEKLLGLSVDRTEGVSGVIVTVKVPYARSLGPTAAAEPVLLVEHRPKVGLLHIQGKSYFLVNGNHRMAKAYFEGAESIRVRMVARKAAARFLL